MSSGRPRLVVLNGPREGFSVDLSAERPVTIGSSRGSDLHLRDSAVSWNHAHVTHERGESVVEDLRSANGTFLNGQQVERSSLVPADVLTIGNTQISYAVGEVLSSPDQPSTNLSTSAVSPSPTPVPAIEDRSRAALFADLQAAKQALTESREEIERARKERGALERELRDAQTHANDAEKSRQHEQELATAQQTIARERARAEMEASALDREKALAARYDQEIAHGRQALRDRDKKLGELRSELLQLSRQGGVWEVELTTVRQQVEALSNDRDGLRQELLRRDEVLLQRDDELTRLCSQAQEGDLHREALLLDVANLEKERLAQAQQLEAEKQTLLSNHRDELDRTRAEYEETLRRLIDENRNLVVTHRDEIERIEEDHKTALSQSADEHEKLLAASRQEFDHLMGEHAVELEATVAAQRQSDDARLAVEAQLKKMHRGIEELTRERDATRVSERERASRAELLQDQLNELHEALEERDAECGELRTHVQQLVDEGKKHLAELLESREQVEQLDADLQLLSSEHAAHTDDFGLLKNELERERARFAVASQDHQSEIEVRHQNEDALNTSLSDLMAELADERASRAEELLELETLRAEHSRLDAEVAILRGYVEDLKKKIGDKDRLIEERRQEARKQLGEESTRLLREQRKLEALVRDLRSGVK